MQYNNDVIKYYNNNIVPIIFIVCFKEVTYITQPVLQYFFFTKSWLNMENMILGSSQNSICHLYDILTVVEKIIIK